jgi:tRNA threonylcarbamoyladenosine biosynthesis protein TsaE
VSRATEYVSAGPEETRALGERLGAALERGDVVLLEGELGGGATTFVQGVARGLGFVGSVSSKSFVLLGEYRGRVTLYHADLYRLENPDQVTDLALEEVCAGGALVVEWPEHGRDALPPEDLLIRFDAMGETHRRLRITAGSERGTALAAAVAAGHAPQPQR